MVVDVKKHQPYRNKILFSHRHHISPVVGVYPQFLFGGAATEKRFSMACTGAIQKQNGVLF